MVRVVLALLVVLAGSLAAASAEEAHAPGEPRGPFHRLWMVELEGPIDAMQRAYLLRRFEAAKTAGIDCFILRVESPGGLIVEAKEIGDALLEMPDSIHTIAWVPKEASSAAAWISLACDEIVLTPYATIGDCQPILMNPTGAPIPVGEKIETVLRAWFRAYADRKNHPVLLAQAMVSEHLEVLEVRERNGERRFFVEGAALDGDDPERIVVPEAGLRAEDVVQVGAPVVAKGQLLTLTGREALDVGFIDRRIGPEGLPADEDEFLAAIQAPGATLERISMSAGERAGRWLLGITGVLAAVIGIGAMLFLWQGSTLAGVIGASALVLLLLITGTVEHLHGLPLFLLALGLVLLAVEVFVLPGFGIAGVLGIASLAFGALLLTTGASLPDHDIPLTQEAVVRFGLQFVVTMLACIAVVVVAARTMPGRLGGRHRGPGVLPAGGLERAEITAPAHVGDRGVALTVLRPSGRARFGASIVDVVTDGGYVEAKRPVVVLRTEGHVVVVREVEEAPA
ncbi:MAG: nodulation protein NfeD [Planctomycetota bacterium]